MDKDELTAWALRNGWQVLAGAPSLTKPSAPKEAIVRIVFKATVVNLEVKKPAGKWEKISSESYAKIQPDPDTGVPQGLGFEKIPSFSMLMQENKDRQIAISAALTAADKLNSVIFAASEKAIEKADANAEKWRQNANEWRAAILGAR